MLLDILGASLFGNMLASKRAIREGEGAIAACQGQDVIRAGKDF